MLLFTQVYFFQIPKGKTNYKLPANYKLQKEYLKGSY